LTVVTPSVGRNFAIAGARPPSQEQLAALIAKAKSERSDFKDSLL
jgi:hypothetical protein